MFMFWVPLCTLIEFFFCMHFRHCHCGFRFYHIYLFVCFFPILGLSELPSDRPPPPPPPSPCVLSPRTKTRTQNNNNNGLLFCFYRESRCGVNWSGKATPFLIARVRHMYLSGDRAAKLWVNFCCIPSVKEEVDAPVTEVLRRNRCNGV